MTVSQIAPDRLITEFILADPKMYGESEAPTMMLGAPDAHPLPRARPRAQKTSDPLSTQEHRSMNTR
jgi:hypothetical protein